MFKRYLLLFLLTISHTLFALPEDREQVLKLAADSADLNQQTHKGEYTGHVHLDQGTSHLRAAKAITEGNEKNQLILAIALGDKENQAHFWTQTAQDKPLLHAFADTIHYYPERHLIELIGKARVVQGDNSFSASKIAYDTLKQHVVSKSDTNSRTLIILHPENKAEKK